MLLNNPPRLRSELAELYEQEGRRLISDSVCGELVAAVAEGPRATDRFAAVSAAAVAGLAGTARAAEIVANFLDRCGLLGGECGSCRGTVCFVFCRFVVWRQEGAGLAPPGVLGARPKQQQVTSVIPLPLGQGLSWAGRHAVCAAAS